MRPRMTIAKERGRSALNQLALAKDWLEGFLDDGNDGKSQGFDSAIKFYPDS